MASSNKDRPHEGVFFKKNLNGMIDQFGYEFDSAFGRINPIIIIGLLILGTMAVFQSKFYEFLFFFILLLIVIFYFLKKNPALFYGSREVYKIIQSEKLGQINKEQKLITGFKIVKQTVSAKARIVNPKEVKELNEGE
ncbi:MAG: hypothetical protein Q7R95_08945 [bacterium]|nr:hypothetical protein [bacterium]